MAALVWQQIFIVFRFCMFSATSPEVGHLHPLLSFWQQICGVPCLELSCFIPTPLILFLFLQVIAIHRDHRLFVMVVLVWGRIIVSHLYQSRLAPSYCGGSWLCYGYCTDPAVDAGRVVVAELIRMWIALR